MQIKPIRSAQDHQAALQEIEGLMAAEMGTPEGDRLDVLTTLVQSWEQQHCVMDLPDPVEAIKFRIEQLGLGIKDLEPMIGKSNRVYEILARSRKLTLPMIRRLHTELGIPLESLIKETTLA